MQTDRPAGSVRFFVLDCTVLLAALLIRRPPGAVSCFLRFYRPLYYSYALRGRSLFVSRFSHRPAFLRPSGGSIFLLVKKDRGERHAKGLQSRPLESGFYTGVRRGDVRASYVFAVMQLTRFRPVRGVWQAHCFHGLDCTAPTAAKTLAL